jgi:hypothetical protein
MLAHADVKREHMKQVASLQLNKHRRKYNDVVRCKLDSAGIEFKQVDTPYGYKIMVTDNDFSVANRIVLSISHTNPKY